MNAALGDTAVQLPWLAPSVASLVALTRPHRPDSGPIIAADPGALLLLLRNSPHDQPPEPFRPTRAVAPALRLAQQFLDEPPGGILDRRHPAVRAVLGGARATSRIARALAEKSERVDPDCAAAAGLLAPLGWLAAAAIRPDVVAACLADDQHAAHSDAVQQRFFGATTAELARRLARRWELPGWLAAVVGYLDLPATLAPTFGGEPILVTVVQAAISLTARAGTNSLCMTVGTQLDDSLARLGVDPQAVAVSAAPADAEIGCNPYDAPLLRELLDLAAENAGRRELHLLPRLESEVDHLHRLLLHQRAEETERLRAQKLSALAEFAAGAGHEINNPLAVISGQAQYLLGLEADPDRQRSLRTVVQQTQRVHQILTDLMQFARPPRPRKQAVDVRDLVRETVGGLVELAAERRVRVEVLAPAEACVTDGDPKQILTALACLARNAIEAAGVPGDAEALGWARLRVEVATIDRLRITVEDSGPGPAKDHAEHLFDPFFSGRPAGRGRGLGLPTAWRLAREQGGDVTFESTPDGPTRFVLTLPRIPVLPVAEPLAA